MDLSEVVKFCHFDLETYAHFIGVARQFVRTCAINHSKISAVQYQRKIDRDVRDLAEDETEKAESQKQNKNTQQKMNCSTPPPRSPSPIPQEEKK